MLITGITPLDPAGGGRISFMALVESRGEVRGSIVRSQPGGRVIVSTPVGRFSLVLPESASAGQTVRFQVVEGQLQAELGSSVAREATTPSPPAVTRAGLDQTLAGLGLAANDSSRTVARAFIQAGLPLHADSLRAVLDVLGGILRPEQGPALALLLAKGAPISPALLEQMTAARPESLTRLLQRLVQVHDRLLEMVPSGPERQALQSLLDRLIGLSVSLGDDSSITADHLERFFSNSGLDLERLLGHLLGRGTSTPNLLTLASQNLKADLLLLQQLLGALLPRLSEGAARGLVQELQAALQQALGGLETSQLTMAPTRQGDQNFPVLFFLPAVLDESMTTMLLIVEQEAGSAGGGDKRTRLTVQVEMSALGTVRAQLTVEQKNLAVRFLVRDEETRETIALNSAQLAERLEAAGYRVDAVLAQVEKALAFPGSLLESGPSEGTAHGPEPGNAEGPAGVDVRG